MSFIEFKNICKKYAGNDKNSVTDFNLDIEEKEFIAFVGPSGCGKSTTLRMIAGFEEITSGDLFIDGKRVNEVAPADRGISMVFQNYALYPHMTVDYFYQPSKESGIPTLITQGVVVLGILTFTQVIGRLTGFFETVPYLGGKLQKNRVRFLRGRKITGEGGGIADPFCLRRFAFDAGIIDSVCIFPQHFSVAFQMKAENRRIHPSQIANRMDIQFL